MGRARGAARAVPHFTSAGAAPKSAVMIDTVAPDLPSADEIEEGFALIDDWEERYAYVIELGRALPPLADHLRTPDTKVEGCVSQVWLVSGESDGRLSLAGDSDAMIVRGLVAILLAYYGGRTPEDAADADVEAYLKTLELSEHLTPQRSNGLNSMVKRIRRDATALASA